MQSTRAVLNIHMLLVFLCRIVYIALNMALFREKNKKKTLNNILSNSHSVINKNHSPYNLSECVKSTPKETDCCHTCALVTGIITYIYRSLIGLPKNNGGIQPLLFALRTKLQIQNYHQVVMMPNSSRVNVQNFFLDIYYKVCLEHFLH